MNREVVAIGPPQRWVKRMLSSCGNVARKCSASGAGRARRPARARGRAGRRSGTGRRSRPRGCGRRAWVGSSGTGCRSRTGPAGRAHPRPPTGPCASGSVTSTWSYTGTTARRMGATRPGKALVASSTRRARTCRCGPRSTSDRGRPPAPPARRRAVTGVCSWIRAPARRTGGEQPPRQAGRGPRGRRGCGSTRRPGTSGERTCPGRGIGVEQLDVLAELAQQGRVPRAARRPATARRRRRSRRPASKAASMPSAPRSPSERVEVLVAEPVEGGELVREVGTAVGGAVGDRGGQEAAVAAGRPERGGAGVEHEHVALGLVRERLRAAHRPVKPAPTITRSASTAPVRGGVELGASGRSSQYTAGAASASAFRAASVGGPTGRVMRGGRRRRRGAPRPARRRTGRGRRRRSPAAGRTRWRPPRSAGR